MPNEANVNTPVPQFQRMKPSYDLADHLTGGTREFRAQGETYLPREKGEGANEYQARLQKAVLFGAWKKTVRKLSAMPFTKPATMQDPDRERDPREQRLDVSVDRRNTTVDQFARKLVTSFLRKGSAHFMVDMPPFRQGLSQAERDNGDIRPYFALLDPSNIIGWEHDFNVATQRNELVSLRVRDTRMEKSPGNKFELIKVERVRHYEPNKTTIWIKRDDDWVIERTVETTYPSIPLVTMDYQAQEPFCPSLPLDDLAMLNVEHYQSSADQRNILHVARIPILYGAGFEEGSLKTDSVGVGQFFTNTNPDATLGYVEIEGKAIDAGQRDIEGIENRMSLMGLELLVKKQQETATRAMINSKEQTCELQDIVVLVEGMIQKGYQVAGQYLEQEWDTKWIFFKEFGIDARQHEDLQTLLAARGQNEISRETWLRELSRRSVVEELDVDVEMEKLAQEEKEDLERLSLTQPPRSPEPGNDN